jgi:peroxiredoxin
VGYNNGVGRQAPTFTITATDGNEIDLKQYRGDWCPVLVFVAVKAPGIEQLLTQLSSSSGALWGLRGQLIGLCGGSPDEVKELAARVKGLSFPLLPDDGRLAAMYGALKQDGQLRTTVIVVDRAGKIVWQADRAELLEPAAIVAAFREVVR